MNIKTQIVQQLLCLQDSLVSLDQADFRALKAFLDYLEIKVLPELKEVPVLKVCLNCERLID
jgi:hypothetical protein